MHDPYCRYCGQLPGRNPDCQNHPKSPSQLDRLGERVSTLEAEIAELRLALNLLIIAVEA